VCAADYPSEAAKDVDDASLSTHEIHEELSFLRLLHPLTLKYFRIWKVGFECIYLCARVVGIEIAMQAQ
jgi:hypothetical protein